MQTGCLNLCKRLALLHQHCEHRLKANGFVVGHKVREAVPQHIVAAVAHDFRGPGANVDENRMVINFPDPVVGLLYQTAEFGFAGLQGSLGLLPLANFLPQLGGHLSPGGGAGFDLCFQPIVELLQVGFVPFSLGQFGLQLLVQFRLTNGNGQGVGQLLQQANFPVAPAAGGVALVHHQQPPEVLPVNDGDEPGWPECAGWPGNLHGRAETRPDRCLQSPECGLCDRLRSIGRQSIRRAPHGPKLTGRLRPPTPPQWCRWLRYRTEKMLVRSACSSCRTSDHGGRQYRLQVKGLVDVLGQGGENAITLRLLCQLFGAGLHQPFQLRLVMLQQSSLVNLGLANKLPGGPDGVLQVVQIEAVDQI